MEEGESLIARRRRKEGEEGRRWGEQERVPSLAHSLFGQLERKENPQTLVKGEGSRMDELDARSLGVPGLAFDIFRGWE